MASLVLSSQVLVLGLLHPLDGGLAVWMADPLFFELNCAQDFLDSFLFPSVVVSRIFASVFCNCSSPISYHSSI